MDEVLTLLVYLQIPGYTFISSGNPIMTVMIARVNIMYIYFFPGTSEFGQKCTHQAVCVEVILFYFGYMYISL